MALKIDGTNLALVHEKHHFAPRLPQAWPSIVQHSFFQRGVGAANLVGRDHFIFRKDAAEFCVQGIEDLRGKGLRLGHKFRTLAVLFGFNEDKNWEMAGMSL